MADHKTSEFEGFNKSNAKDRIIKINQNRVIMLEESVHELIEKMEKMERSMHVMVKGNSPLKNRIDELNDKQKDNEKVVKIHEEINAGRRHKKKWKMREKLGRMNRKRTKKPAKNIWRSRIWKEESGEGIR